MSHGGILESPPGDITRLLSELKEGKQHAANALMPMVYDELRRLAGNHMRRERADHTLQPTALVHETYLRMVKQQNADWSGRAHFFGVASSLMRRILVDHARGFRAEKRGGGMGALPLDEALVFTPLQSDRLLALDEALNLLSVWDPRQARIVELLYFGGLTATETAEVMGISVRTVKRDWSMARAWLQAEVRRECE